MNYRDFLIIGHPRGGTGYSSKLFKTYGFDIGHEKVNSSGISSWCFASPNGWNYWTDKRKRNEFYFKWIILAVRHPLSIISSLIFEHQKNQDTLDLISRWTGYQFKSTNPLDLATEQYLFWEEYMWENNNIDWWFRVENQQVEVYKHLEFLGYEPYYWDSKDNINPHIIPRDVNTRERPESTSGVKLEDISSQYKSQIQTKLTQYGYSPEY